MSTGTRGRRAAVLAGVFAVAAATLMYEILLTRIFSVTMWYHFAFLAVAAALLGMTLGAVLVQARPRTFSAAAAPGHLATSALFFATGVPATFLLHLAIPVVPTLTTAGLLSVLITYAFIAVPFVASGVCICLALTRLPGPVSSIYAADLAGAACGCLATVGALKIADAPAAVFLVAALAAAGAGAFAVATGARRALAAALVLIAATLALGGTAAAAVIITDNSQVAPNTISGHKPPSGKHSNLIAGSVNAQDVADNTLGGADILEPTLTGNARKLIFHTATGPIPTQIATVGPYAIKAACEEPSPAHWALTLYVNGPAGTVSYTYLDSVNDNGIDDPTGGFRSDTRPIPANQDAPIFGIFADTSYQTPPNGNFHHAAGTVMLRSGQVLVQVDFDVVVDATDQGPNGCNLLGTATRAT